MDCDRCHERPARYHVTRVVNGQTVRELDLCERCATEQGELPAAAAPGAQSDTHLTIQQLLAGLLAGVGAEVATGGSEAPPAGARCARCGCTSAEFARTGLVGCPECYDAFSGQMEALIRRVQGQTRHEGKVPRRTGATALRRRALDDLRRELEGAVAREEFETAAVLRDRIRAVQAEAVEGRPAPAGS